MSLPLPKDRFVAPESFEKVESPERKRKRERKGGRRESKKGGGELRGNGMLTEKRGSSPVSLLLLEFIVNMVCL